MPELISLYESCMDMDMRDYVETMQKDFEFLAQRMRFIGIDALKQELAEAGYLTA